MTVSTTYTPATYTGDGSTTEFALNHKVFQSSHLSITLDGVSTSAWSATGYGDDAGVTVTFDTAPASGVAIVIRRVVPYTQDTDLENFDGNPADVTEKQFDLQSMADQQIAEESDRAIISPIGTSLTSNEISGTIDTTTRVLTLTTSGPATSLFADLSATIDVSLTGESSGDFLKYDGTNWINRTAAEVRADLSLEVGTDVQAYDAGLADIAGLTPSDGNFVVGDGANWVAESGATAFNSIKQAASDTATGVVEKATQAEMEAETADKYPDASLVKYAPSACKAWVNFNGTGTVAVRTSYNIDSITDNGTGDYTVNIGTDFSSADYSASITVGEGSNTVRHAWVGGAVPTAGAFRLKTTDGGNTPTDTTYVMVQFFGDQ